MPRYNIEFSEEVNEALEALMKRQGGSKADVIRRAIALERWFDKAGEDGHTILVDRNDGSPMREVIQRPT